MILKKLDISVPDELSFIKELYMDSFPLCERRPENTMLKLYQDNPIFDIAIIMENNNYVGFLTYWSFKEFIFAEHFAISPNFRNGGYGGKVMQKFIEEAAHKPIILEVELPTTIMSERRIGFYQRLGFKLWTNIQYQQPSYHKNDEVIPMKLMSIGNIDLEKDIKEIRSIIYESVYNC